MPSVNEALHSDLSNYVQSTPMSFSIGASPLPGVDMQPGRGTVTRCPLPPVWTASPDSLRQFYLNGSVPQARIMTPVAPTSSSSSGTSNVQTTTAVFISGGGGTSGSGTSTSNTAQQVSITTPSLGPGLKFSGSLSISNSFQLLNVAVGSPSRIQLYGTASAQTQDLNRGLDIAPPAGTGQNIICDLALDTAPFTWSFQNRTGANADSPQAGLVYVTITNLDSTSEIVTLTLTYASIEK